MVRAYKKRNTHLNVRDKIVPVTRENCEGIISIAENKACVRVLLNNCVLQHPHTSSSVAQEVLGTRKQNLMEVSPHEENHPSL